MNRRFLDALTPTATTTSSKSRRRAGDDVEVTVGHRVEGSGADGAAHGSLLWGRGGEPGTRVTVPKHGLAVPALAGRRVPVGPRQGRAARGALDHDQRPRDQPPVVAQRGQHGGDGVGSGCG